MALLPEADRRAQKPGLMMANIYRTLLREIEADGFRVLHQRTSLTPLRKLWIAWRTHWRGPLTPLRVAVVGGGWAGIAAAVHARRAGHAVQVFEMAPQLGGRARSVGVGRLLLDNGQHILIGAYTATLELMQLVGADTCARCCIGSRWHCSIPTARACACRQARRLHRLRARPCSAVRAGPGPQRLALLAHAARWAALALPLRARPAERRRRCAPACRRRCARELIEPLCVAALNTPAATAPARRCSCACLRDALFSGHGSADLLLPAASAWRAAAAAGTRLVRAQGVALHLGTRVNADCNPRRPGWRVNDRRFDAVVLACSAAEAARLCAEP